MTDSDAPEGRALTRLVVVDGVVWEAGSVPPPGVAKRIKNPQCWQPVEPEPGLDWGQEGNPRSDVAFQDVVPAAPAANGLANLEEQPGATEQSAVIPAGAGHVISRDPSEPFAPANAPPEVPGKPNGPEQPNLGAELILPEPPRSGKGASESAWRGFAESRGIEVPPDADRSQIIAACRDGGFIQ